MQQSEQLSILGAVYGKQDVTNVIRGLVQFGSTQIQANPQLFGDSMPGVPKTLVIVYQYGLSKPIVLIAKEGDNVTIASNNNQPEWVTYQPGQVAILGAAYGLANVTDKVAQRAQNNSLDIQAENSIFGETWSGVRKVLTVVYRDAHGEAKTAITEENGRIKIEGSQQQYQQQQQQYQYQQQYYQQIPKILGAAYGKANVTEKVRSIVANGNLKLTAENNIFGDSWYGVGKSLVIVYQFGDNKPQVGITREQQTLTLSQPNQFSEWTFMNNGQIQILGAAYGLADVTNQVASKVQGSSLLVRATNQTFGDSWYGTGKTLVVVYQDAQGNINTSIAPEGEAIKINAPQPRRANPGQIPKILGAAYGKADVTEKVRSIVANGDIEILAKNEIFGDSWYGVGKSLVVVYQYGNNHPQVRFTSEHEALILDEPNQPSEWAPMNYGHIQILGAVYGLADVTNQVASRVQGSALQVQAANQILGDSWYGVRKTLVVVYQDTQGNLKTSITEEGGTLKISAPLQPKLKILGAAYGRTNVTDKVRSMVADGNLQILAENYIFGDSFYGVPKSLVVVYQFGDAKPRVGIAAEHGTLSLSQGNQYSQSFPMDPEHAQILGAAYGLADVTSQVGSRIQNSVLEVRADNESLGDGWHGTRKTLVVVSQDPQGIVNTHIVEEGGNLKLNFSPPLAPTILGAAYGKANITDQVRAQVADGRRQIQALNNIYGDSFPNVQKSLVIVYQFGNSPPQVAIAKENQTVNLAQSHQSYQQWSNPQIGQPCILGAAYGLANVTDKVVQKLQNSILDVKVDNGVFGDSWPGTRKTLVVVYQDPQGNINTSVVEEGGNLKISFQQQQQWGGNWDGQPNYGGNFQPQHGINFQQQPQYQNNNNPYGGYQPQYGNYGQPQYGNNFQQGNNNNPYNNPYGGYQQQQQQQFNNNQQQYGGGGYGGFGKQF